jgi:hypothetical protein
MSKENEQEYKASEKIELPETFELTVEATTKSRLKGCFISIVVCVLAILVFRSCIMGMEESNNNDPKGNVGNYIIKIDSFRITENYGDPIIIVKYSFTNLSEEADSFLYSISAEAYQNGVELDTPISVDSAANYSFENKNAKIEPGITIDVEVAYELKDLNADVKVVVKERFDKGGNQITKTFSLDSILAPNKPNEQSPNDLGNFNIVISEYRLATSYNNDIIIIKYIFTNNSNEAESFRYAVSALAFQGGIELETAYIVDDDIDYSTDARDSKILPGTTIEVEIAYKLRSTNENVYVEVTEKWLNDKKVAKTFIIN